MPKRDAVRRLLDARVLLVLDGDQSSEDFVRAAMDAGVGAVEISVGDDASAVAAVVQAKSDFVVAAGAVMTAARAWEAVEAGAHIVSATPLDAEIAAVCEAADVATVAVVAAMEDVAPALALRPDFLRLPAELVQNVTADTPVIIDAPMPADPPPGAVLAVSLRSLDARSPEELRANLSELIVPTTNPSDPGIS